MRARLAVAAVVIAGLVGCGGDDRRPPAPARAAAPQAPQALVFMSRNWEYAVPEEVAVYADGRVDYRYLLHTKMTIPHELRTLSPAALASLRRLVDGADLHGAQVLGVEPPRGRYRYLLRLRGQTITTVDGHLTAGVRPLIRRLSRLEDRINLNR